MTTTTPNRTTDSTSNAPAPYTGFDHLFIGGHWVTGRSEHKLRPINPYRQDVIMEIPAADKRDLEDAYQEAQRAQVAWAEALPSERSLIMRRAD
jgi:aldehyde dehydrogenase (NAD+)